MKLFRIGATTFRIGAKAVASEFLSCVREDISRERLLFVSPLYCARF
nr:MAG: hypothetical protein [Bacteriophage sp.]